MIVAITIMVNVIISPCPYIFITGRELPPYSPTGKLIVS